MGQLLSAETSNKSNDDLINALIRRDYIYSPNVERVFRCVDRGLYYTSDNKENAYRDSAWLFEKIHLSAPSIYAAVLECLDLRTGNKFLNIGSGVGYFSTVAGLLLGVTGVNHGIEIHQSVIDIAYQKLEEFKLNAAGIDYFELCEPVFIEGNACELSPVGYYDRVYCGAGVPPAEAEFMKSLIKIGGVLVMPLEGNLVKIIRESEHLWRTREVLEVQFSELVVPEQCSFNTVKFPSVVPISLQELCRSSIRATIRDRVKENNPHLEMRIKCNQPKKSCGDKLHGNRDQALTEYVRLQYGLSEDGMLNIRNIVDAFAGLDDAISDVGSISGNEANEEVEEDNNDSNSNGDDDEGENTSERCDESSKRKSSEAGCSDQNKTPPEKPKRMRMGTPLSPDRHTTTSQSSSSNDDLWQTMSHSSSEADNDSESWVSSLDDTGLVDDDDDEFGGVYNSLFDSDSSHESDADSEVVRESKQYTFLSKRTDNTLSKMLKDEIDLLPVPALIKLFLNYNQRD